MRGGDVIAKHCLASNLHGYVFVCKENNKCLRDEVSMIITGPIVWPTVFQRNNRIPACHVSCDVHDTCMYHVHHMFKVEKSSIFFPLTWAQQFCWHFVTFSATASELIYLSDIIRHEINHNNNPTIDLPKAAAVTRTHFGCSPLSTLWYLQVCQQDPSRFVFKFTLKSCVKLRAQLVAATANTVADQGLS